MLSVNTTTVAHHPLTSWVPEKGFIDVGWSMREELFTVPSAEVVEEKERINVLAYVANGTIDELNERLERIYLYLTMRPELRLVDVVEDIDGRRLRQVARLARGRVDAIVTTVDSFDGPEHLKIIEEILSYFGIRLIVTGSYGI